MIDLSESWNLSVARFIGTIEQVLRKLLNPESHQMMTMKHLERKQSSSCDFVHTKITPLICCLPLIIGYRLSSCDLTFDQTPWKALVSTVAGFRGCQLMEINSNGCFPGTFTVLFFVCFPHVFASIAQFREASVMGSGQSSATCLVASWRRWKVRLGRV